VAVEEFTRWFLAIFFSGVAGFYTVRVILLQRRRGRSPVYDGEPGSRHRRVHRIFRVFRAAIFGLCVICLGSPEVDRYIVIIELLWHPAVLLAGAALLLAGFATVLVIHFHMGENWRSGTRDTDRTALVTTGPFTVSRYPMMMAVVTAQTGFFLALPSLFSLLCLAVGVWAVLAQVDIEEVVLEQRFGDAYRSYCKSTPRWLRFGMAINA